ncbi:metallophosphoesterase family protein [bacterium SCSIO 12643]|nr:metallophosphoesterase family protein [bacterium SCSIO 12643]
MTKIGLLSDTHSYIDPKVYKYFEHVDEIWHAGDIGTIEVTDQLSEFKPVRAVYGNIDNHVIRAQFKEVEVFELDGVKVLMIHIGGYPKRYVPQVKQLLLKEKPDLFICGHSHILKVIYDKELQLLHLNPGAAGFHGFHKIKTLLRFELNSGKIENLEIIELGPRNK